MSESHGGVRGDGIPVCHLPPTMQTDATLNQANPVQNTWYTVLNAARNCRLYYILSIVLVANETLEVRITVDGHAYTGAQAAVFGTGYYWCIGPNMSVTPSPNPMSTAEFYTFLEGKTITVEIRKTTVAGAGNLQCWISYATWP